MPDLKARYHIKSLEVFGSFSRQDATPQSDLDLLVEFDEHDHLSLLGYIHLENELGDLVGVKVDLVEKKMLPSPILERVMNEAVRI
jgi:predicted nucleotidyltransferase